MNGLVVPDVSEFQNHVDATYPRDFLIFRAVDGDGYLDAKFLANANTITHLYQAHRLHGVIAYQVYRPVNVASQYRYFWNAIGPKVPPWLKGVMIDVESWQGAIRGDHSAQINALYGMHAHRMGGWNTCISYGNWGDLSSIYPHRDKRCRFIEANYGSWVPARPGKIGQQYYGVTNDAVPRGLPRSTSPFGNCDHNVFPSLANGAALAALLSPPMVVVKPKPKPKPKPVAKPVAKHKPPIVVKPVAKPPVVAKPPLVVKPPAAATTLVLLPAGATVTLAKPTTVEVLG